MDGAVLVFVYGTLRRGGSNHFRMEGLDFIAEGVLNGRLYQMGGYPGLLLDGAAGPVCGEVFKVPEERIAALDAYEGDEYRRVRVAVTPADGVVLDAWVWEWLGPVDELSRIHGGDWLAVGGC
jgi:gamma-glutamylcyclotransferase (GGCT)/AIG2-like uncharacterized protein YtfP